MKKCLKKFKKGVDIYWGLCYYPKCSLKAYIKQAVCDFKKYIMKGVLQMTTGQIMQTLFEVVFGGFIIWGLFNKDTLDKIEDEIMLKIQKKLKGGKKS